jgi:hypothetical protein
MPTHKLTPEIINAAIVGFEQQKLRIDTQITELRSMLHGGRTGTVATQEAPSGKRRKMSAAARKRIGDAQRMRWAASKGQSEAPSEVVTTKRKRKLSAAGRKAISEATKRRWAARKAAAVETAPVVVKKATKKAVVKAAAKKTGGKRPQTKKAAKEPEEAATATA